MIKSIHKRLDAKGVKTDYRATRLRFGFALYHNLEDIERLAAIVNEVIASTERVINLSISLFI